MLVYCPKCNNKVKDVKFLRKTEFRKEQIGYRIGMPSKKEKISVKLTDIELSPLVKGDDTLIKSIRKRRKFEEQEWKK